MIIYDDQVGIYKEHNPNMEIVSFKSKKRSIKAKRQFIYDKFGDCFMLDDDVSKMARLYTKERDRNVDKKTATAIINNTYQTAKELGAYLFGFSTFIREMTYRANQPFLFSGFINGCAIGIRKHPDLNFGLHEKFLYSDDWYVSLLNAYHNRYLFRDRRFCFIGKDTFHNPGGLSSVQESGN